MRVTCHLGVDQDFYHHSHLHTGLALLAEEGALDLHFRPPPKAKTFYSLGGWTMLHVEVPHKPLRRIAVDTVDRSDEFSLPLAQDADVYLKRSFHPPDLSCLPADLQAKVIPYGLNYACRSPRQTHRVLRATASSLLGAASRALISGAASRDALWHRIRQFQVIPPWSFFELPPDRPAETVILFQTRLWDPAIVFPDNGELVNRNRIDLIRALRREFPRQFRGGLAPEPYAKKHFPDLLATEAFRHHEFIEFGKRFAIGIYTRGLHHSDAFKLPEYLASSKAILAEPFRNTLPSPLVAGQHYLAFDDTASCLAHCENLLRDHEALRALRHQTWQYYLSQVRPQVHIADCLRRALNSAENQAILVQ